MSVGPCRRAAVPGNSGPCPRACDVDLLSWATRAGVRGPVGLTSCPGLLRLLSQIQRGPPALPGDSSSVPKSRGVNQHPRATRARVRWPAESTICPRLLWLMCGASGVEYTPGELRLMSGCDSQWFQQALLGDSGQCPWARAEEQLSRATRAHVRGPVMSTC